MRNLHYLSIGATMGAGCAGADPVEEKLAYCAETYGQGEEGTVTEAHRFCDTSHPVTEFTYDPSEYLSSEAAICAAQANGLQPGVEEYRAFLEVCEEGAVWVVWSFIEQTCYNGSYSDKVDSIELDARTGEALGGISTSIGDGECDE